MSRSKFKQLVIRALENAGILVPIKRTLRSFSPTWHAEQRAFAKEFSAFLNGVIPAVDYGMERYPQTRRALVVGYVAPSLAIMQTPLLLALRIAGYHVSVLLGSAKSASADFYRAMGVQEFVETEKHHARTDIAGSRAMLRDIHTTEQLFSLKENGISVGKFAVSTLIRWRRMGEFDPADSSIREPLIEALAASRQAAQRAVAIIAEARPDLVCFYDRGYTPDGELSDAALNSGARVTTWNAAHKSGFLMSKRYGPHNKDVHPGMPSPEFWSELKAMEWTPSHWNTLRAELEQCYRTGAWYDSAGTQRNKEILSRDALIGDLGLDPTKPTAVIFPHIFWDASFFWGKDLFANYRQWFCETLKAAAENRALNWIVKVHPANVVKNLRDNYVGEYAEIVAVNETLGVIPEHIKVIPPNSAISTFSLFDMMDYCITVRGTVGIEAAAFGRQVLTAGSGRYDGFGFTIDSGSTEEYLQNLARLQTLPQPMPDQTELARRYAYGLFICRPLETVSMHFSFAQDSNATLTTKLNLPKSVPMEKIVDLSRLATWLANPLSADLIGRPIAE